ncbi:MAG: hypothetical protein AABZ60_11905, partial [Planctomycetota bacterium]
MFTLIVRRPLLALPYTILAQKNRVRLIAGEDFRYTFEGASLEEWLPSLLNQLDGSKTLDDLFQTLSEPLRPGAIKLMQQLYGERIVVDAPVSQNHVPEDLPLEVSGQGTLREWLSEQNISKIESSQKQKLSLLCQDNLDYQTALEFNRHSMKSKSRWFWVSYGAMTRAYVSPLFLSNAGPCLECLIRQFKQISPLPEIYEELMQQPPVAIKSVEKNVPEEAVQILKGIRKAYEDH